LQIYITLLQVDYYWFENGFSSEEVDKILDLSKNYEFEQATTISGDPKSIRNSTIKWMNPSEETSWVYDRLMGCVKEANNVWQFNLYSILDDIQYTEYRGGGGHYNWHIDIGPGAISHRKVSVVVQLSDSSEYTGGILEVSTGSNSLKVSNKKGAVILFPSFLQHRVTPVASGLRKSLVLWAGGEHFK
jgi:PKHD-type hydroxylase